MLQKKYNFEEVSKMAFLESFFMSRNVYAMIEEKKLKLIWDFHGPNAEATARHHSIHLKEYLTSRKLFSDDSGFEKLSDNHFIAFLVVPESAMPPVRDDLRPHRGQIFHPNM